MAEKFHIRNGSLGLTLYDTANDSMIGIAANEKPEQWLVFELSDAMDVASSLGLDWYAKRIEIA